MVVNVGHNNIRMQPLKLGHFILASIAQFSLLVFKYFTTFHRNMT